MEIGAPKPAFMDFLVATLQKAHGLGEEKAKLCIVDKRNRIKTYSLIDQCIEKELLKAPVNGSCFLGDSFSRQTNPRSSLQHRTGQ